MHFAVRPFFVSYLAFLVLAILLSFLVLQARQLSLPDIVVSIPHTNTSSILDIPDPVIKEPFSASALRGSGTDGGGCVSAGTEPMPLSRMQRDSKAYTDINRTPVSTSCEGSGNCRDYILGYIPEKDSCSPPLNPQFQYWYFPSVMDRPCSEYSSSNKEFDNTMWRYPRCASDAGSAAGPYISTNPETLTIPKF